MLIALFTLVIVIIYNGLLDRIYLTHCLQTLTTVVISLSILFVMLFLLVIQKTSALSYKLLDEVFILRDFFFLLRLSANRFNHLYYNNSMVFSASSKISSSFSNALSIDSLLVKSTPACFNSLSG